MKRLVPVLAGGLFLAALVAVPAQAATGALDIDGAFYQNPSGCVAFANATVPTAIANNTDAVATVYSSTNCSGTQMGTVPPGGKGTYEAGSVQVS